MNSWWQHLPETINPIAFTVGFFSLYWYAVFFLGGVLSAFLLASYLIRKGEALYPKEIIFDGLVSIFLGAVIGGRVGYVLFYNFNLFFHSPLAIVLPYDFGRGVWTGISGMSYHGGLLGAIIALGWFSYRKKLAFWKMADFVVLLVPLATFFGRLGNFFNGELFGRITDKPWGMLFPGIYPTGVLRHPSTLYEALLEGGLLFVLLFSFRRKISFPGALACLYVMGYASFRFIGEYFREPDPQIGFLFGGYTLGQLLSVIMFFLGGIFFVWLKHRNYAKIAQDN